jgi:OOP family OmpA-OmpF porin
MTVTAYFDSGKSVLNKQAKAEIDDLLNKIKDIKLEVIVVTGYTDNRGSVAANEKLGMRRAMAAKEYLMSKGIAANEVYTDNKIDSTHKGKGSSASSRRVELEVIGYSSK